MKQHSAITDDQEYVTLPLISVGEAAKYLGVGRRVVYQLIQLGQILAVKNKGNVLIEKASVHAYRAKSKQVVG